MKPKDHKVTQTFQPVLGTEPHKLTIWDKANTCIPDELTCEEAKKMKANDATLKFMHTIPGKSGHPAANVLTLKAKAEEKKAH